MCSNSFLWSIVSILICSENLEISKPLKIHEVKNQCHIILFPCYGCVKHTSGWALLTTPLILNGAYTNNGSDRPM